MIDKIGCGQWFLVQTYLLLLNQHEKYLDLKVENANLGAPLVTLSALAY